MSHHRLPRLSSFILSIGIVALLAACGSTQQEPVGMNSGSTQNARGTFLFDDPNAVKGTVGDTLNVYDVFTTVTTAITVNSVAVSTTSANQNTASVSIPSGFQFLLVHVTVKNLNTSNTKSCPQGSCTEYYSPLSNFRLLDDQGRQWSTTTGAQESCTTAPHTPCYDRLWTQEALNGVPTGASFTTRLDFLVPTNMHAFTFYFAAYRFSTIQNTDYSAATPTAISTSTANSTSTATSTAIPSNSNDKPALATFTLNI